MAIIGLSSGFGVLSNAGVTREGGEVIDGSRLVKNWTRYGYILTEVIVLQSAQTLFTPL
jgi:hypothetical protein